jgi:hypothetical protein
MRRVRPLPLALAAALCAGGATPAAAGAQDVPAAIVTDFRQDGRVAPCDHSAAEVRRALDELPADADVLTPDLRQQLEASSEAHTSGRCRAAGVASEGEAGGAGAGDAPDAAEAQRAADEAIAASKGRPPGSPEEVKPTPQPAPPNAQAPAAQGDAIGRATRVPPDRTGAGDAPAPCCCCSSSPCSRRPPCSCGRSPVPPEHPARVGGRPPRAPRSGLAGLQRLVGVHRLGAPRTVKDPQTRHFRRSV